MRFRNRSWMRPFLLNSFCSDWRATFRSSAALGQGYPAPCRVEPISMIDRFLKSGRSSIQRTTCCLCRFFKSDRKHEAATRKQQRNRKTHVATDYKCCRTDDREGKTGGHLQRELSGVSAGSGGSPITFDAFQLHVLQRFIKKQTWLLINGHQYDADPQAGLILPLRLLWRFYPLKSPICATRQKNSLWRRWFCSYWQLWKPLLI